MGKAHVSAHEWVAGRYRLLEVVHRETNHVCWYAEDAEAGRPRLVTRIGLPDGPDRGSPRRTTTRVLRASELVGLRRPGRVATVIDAVEESHTLWTVTEWIDGTPLGELLHRQGAFSQARAARIGLELLDVLDAAHAEGLTHGELSPGQVYVRDQGPVVVTGFGPAGTGLAPRLTAPSYAAPEQARGEHVGPAADLWALGALLYTMTEGRPPFRDRGRPEATLKAVDRLPPRLPQRAGPLTRTVQELLRRDPRERPGSRSVRAALARVAAEPTGTPEPSGPASHGRVGHHLRRRTVLAGAALAAVSASVAAVAATRGPSGSGTRASDPAPRRPTSGSPGDARPDGGASAAPGPTGEDTGGAPAPSPTPSGAPSPAPSSGRPSPSASAPALPAGYRLRTAPEGFSVALPDGWQRLDTRRVAGLAYRVTFGPGGDDPRTLAVTYSERVGPDPVAVWRDDVQPGLARLAGFRRIGGIRATTYRGHSAADMEWVSGSGKDRVRTYGRGVLLGGRRGFSLRFTAPARAWHRPADTLALTTFLRTFREAAG